ncbi:clumping factor B-like [Bactrocera neohumeralis]|uniref:clumping factor B-like n=1 Tax=Bactrocera neohumeralis TaxID=98809 RepID=UPI00216600CB|nr:clumping factor B-like [Bactrocera neohumeralis]
MRTQAAGALYAFLALSCLGTTLCGVITEIGKPLQQAGNVVNELNSKIPNVANIEPALDSVNTVKDAAKEVGDKISDLNPIENIISPVPELDFFHKLISMLSKLMSSVNPHHSEEHKEDEVSATEDPVDNSSEIPSDSDADEQASKEEDHNSSEVPSDSDDDEQASEDPVDNSSEIPSDSDADEQASEDSHQEEEDDNSSEISGDSDADEQASEEEDDNSSEIPSDSDADESASEKEDDNSSEISNDSDDDESASKEEDNNSSEISGDSDNAASASDAMTIRY